MIVGCYLGELGRIMFFDYCINVFKLVVFMLLSKFCKRFGFIIIFLSYYYYNSFNGSMVDQLSNEFLVEYFEFEWIKMFEVVLYKIVVVIQKRVVGIIVVLIIGLLMCVEEILEFGVIGKKDIIELVVGYIGGCIQYF